VSDKIVLELKNITKVFPGVKALDNVRFDLREGEVHALMGENGAGKSTLIKVITGVYQCDEGEIFFDSKPVVIKTPLEAQKLGVAVIYQTVTAFPDFISAASSSEMMRHRSCDIFFEMPESETMRTCRSKYEMKIKMPERSAVS